MKRTALKGIRLPLATATAVLALMAPASAELVPGSVLKANWGGFPESWALGQDIDMGYYRVPYENLLTVDERGEAQPWLVTEWDLTDEGITMTLRDDVVFHDGTPFNAEAVKALLEGVRDIPGPFAGSFQVIESIDIIDDHTVRANFSAPSPAFATLLASRNLPVISPNAFDSATAPVGTGPWVYDPSSSSEGTRMVFKAFPDYWGEVPAFETIELYGISDRTAEVAALLTGEIDVTDYEFNFQSQIDGADDIDHLSYPSVRNGLIFFDRGPGGDFEDIKVRQAICSAISSQTYIDVSGDFQDVTNQHFVEGTFGYVPDLEAFTYDPERAQQLWEEAGRPTIQATAIAAPFITQRGNIFAQMAGELEGLTLVIQEASVPQYQSEWNTGKYEFGLGGHDELTPYDWYANWFAASGSLNPSGYESPELKAKADAAIAAGSSDEAEGLWQDVMRQIAAEALICGTLRGYELIGWRTDRIENVAGPVYPFEGSAIDFRTVRPVSQ